jgi:hypothetical protein
VVLGNDFGNKGVVSLQTLVKPIDLAEGAETLGPRFFKKWLIFTTEQLTSINIDQYYKLFTSHLNSELNQIVMD